MAREYFLMLTTDFFFFFFVGDISTLGFQERFCLIQMGNQGKDCLQPQRNMYLHLSMQEMDKLVRFIAQFFCHPAIYADGHICITLSSSISVVGVVIVVLHFWTVFQKWLDRSNLNLSWFLCRHSAAWASTSVPCEQLLQNYKAQRHTVFFFKDILTIEDEKLFKACKSVCSSVCQSHYK